MSASTQTIEFAATAQLPELTGKTYFVTGAASGYGAAICKKLLAAGGTVIMADKNLPLLEKAYDELESLPGDPILFPINFESATQFDYDDIAKALSSQFGKLDGLIHNVSLCGPLSPIQQFDTKQWFTQLQVNLNAPFLLHKTLFDLLLAAETAHEIFVLDNLAREHAAYWGGYGVSKKALEELMLVLADETENTSNFHVYGVDPGPIDTASRRKLFPGKNPTDWPSADDKAHLVLAGLLASDKSNNGCIYIDSSK